MKKIIIEIIKIILVFFGAIAIFMHFAEPFHQESERKEKFLNNEGIKTDCIIFDIQQSYKSKYAHYYFYVDGVKYTNAESSKGREVKIGEKYVVIYYKEDPNINRIQYDLKVPQ